jgi:hypothetical protein
MEEMWKKYGKYGKKLWKDMENVKKCKLKCEMIWKIWNKCKSNSENIWKIQKKIVKRYEIYGWNVKWYGKYWKQLWKDMENMEKR